MIYPWQQTQWQQLTQRWNTLPHALLFHGQRGIGKRLFAEQFAQALLCQQPQSDFSACGHCASCHLIQQHSHPDYLLIEPEVDEGNARKLQQIKVDAVREILAFAQLSSHQGGRRIIVIDPAESLNTQAANALLKVLEEPTANVVFLLISHHHDRLLPTILSRLQLWHLPTPSYEQVTHYWQQQAQAPQPEQLAFYAGAPLVTENETVKQLRQQWLNILAKPRLLALMDFAAEFDKHKRPLGEALEWLYKWLVDLGLSREGIAALYYPSHQHSIAQLSDHSEHLWQELVNKLHQLIPYGQHTLNVKLQLEDISIDYLNLITSKKDT